MNGYILGLATAVPPHAIYQHDAMERTLDIFPFTDQQREIVKKLYQNSGIHKRHIVMPDFKNQRPDWHFWGADYPITIPGMTKRNKLYKKEAPLLAHQAAEKAIKSWGGDPLTITHIISVSCTGVVIPGIEFVLVNSLSLSRTIHRLGINFMGCFGAFKGLEVANAFAKSDAKNRILLVCTELCSLHLQADLNSDTLVANSIFADGAAAVIVGSQPNSHEKPLWQMIKSTSFGLEGSVEQMSWEASDHGFFMKLSSFVPISIARHIQAFSKTLLESHVKIIDCNWAIHPGGRAILQIIEQKLQLEKWHTASSWHTLENYGNMSSATFLFVLDQLNQQANAKEWSVGVGFGPGLSVEGILLHRS